MNKEKLLKDWPRVCMSCGGEFVEIFRARRGEEPREYVECKTCKRVIYWNQDLMLGVRNAERYTNRGQMVI